uniref:Thymus, brain and testes associated n=1 Tax=Amphilophus citrinellus TaxID=61819 RepID=A0A3Q0T3H5_AMPCI
MSRAHSPDSREVTAERKFTQMNLLPFTAEFTTTLPKSSPRFGALSHHSFFSRHNPHPHRMRHIQGFTGRPICMVRDDWFVTSSLFPHPLLKSRINRKACLHGCGLVFSLILHSSSVFFLTQGDLILEKCIHVLQDQPEEKVVQRKTQYSAQTGRIIPPSSKSFQRKSQYQRMSHPQPFHDQELMVLEVLCQILQTDSLSTVQQWLLLSGQRGKMPHYTCTVRISILLSSSYKYVLSRLFSSACTFQSLTLYPPSILFFAERIGDAEVLAVHTGTHSPLVSSLQKGESA